MTYIPDPMELMDRRMALLEDRFVDEHTCMCCGEVTEGELICPCPTGDGPGVCETCLGYDYTTEIEPRDPEPDDLEFF